MKHLLIIAVMGMTAGCEKVGIEYRKVEVLEGCQYFACRTYAGSVVYTHKGNCTNALHRIQPSDGAVR